MYAEPITIAEKSWEVRPQHDMYDTWWIVRITTKYIKHILESVCISPCQERKDEGVGPWVSEALGWYCR